MSGDAAEPSTDAGSDAGAGTLEPSARRFDPFAIALGNATLLGVGYLLVRRWVTAGVAFAISAGLILLVGAFGQPGWFWRSVLTVWWLATIVHGFLLAKRPSAAAAPPPGPGESSLSGPTVSGPTLAGSTLTLPTFAVPTAPPPAPTPFALTPPAPTPPAPTLARPLDTWHQRSIAAGVAVVVALAVAYLAFDVRRIQSDAATAHEAGRCDAAIAALAGIHAWHRAVDPFVTSRAADEIAACELVLQALAEEDPAQAATLLAQYLEDDSRRWPGAADRRTEMLLAAAENALDAALDDGDLAQLESGFDILAGVLEARPDRAPAVDAILARYVERLPDVDPCDARANLDWLRDRTATGGRLEEAADRADDVAPAVLIACGDALLQTNGHNALEAYQAVLDRYPDDELAETARAGVNNAEARIELENLRRLVNVDPPRYCSAPAPYRAAPPWQGGGTHLLFPLGSPRFADEIPDEWVTTDPAAATLVLCVEGPTAGRRLRGCDYVGGHTVSLHATRYTVKGYELRTGALKIDTTLEFTAGCPDPLRWTCSFREPDCPPPTDINAEYSTSAVRNAVRPWVTH